MTTTRGHRTAAGRTQRQTAKPGPQPLRAQATTPDQSTDWHPSRPLPNERWEAFVLLIFQATRTGPDCTCNHTDAYQKVYKCSRVSAKDNAARLIANDSVKDRLAWLIEEANRRAMGSAEEADRILWEKVKGKPTDYITVLPDGTRTIEAGPDSPNPHAIKRLKSRRDLSGEGDGKADSDFTDIEVEGLAALALYYRRHGLLAADKLEVTGTLKDALDEAERRGQEKDG